MQQHPQSTVACNLNVNK